MRVDTCGCRCGFIPAQMSSSRKVLSIQRSNLYPFSFIVPTIRNPNDFARWILASLPSLMLPIMSFSLYMYFRTFLTEKRAKRKQGGKDGRGRKKGLCLTDDGVEVADLGFDEKVFEESFSESALAVLMMDVQRVLCRAMYTYTKQNTRTTMK